MRIIKTISRISPFVKTMSGLKRIRGRGVVMPVLSRLSMRDSVLQRSVTSRTEPRQEGGAVRVDRTSIKPLKFLL
jgi:hypothetical protein